MIQMQLNYNPGNWYMLLLHYILKIIYHFFIQIILVAATISTGIMDYYPKHGKTPLLQIKKLKVLLGIMTQVYNLLPLLFHSISYILALIITILILLHVIWQLRPR